MYCDVENQRWTCCMWCRGLSERRGRTRTCIAGYVSSSIEILQFLQWITLLNIATHLYHEDGESEKSLIVRRSRASEGVFISLWKKINPPLPSPLLSYRLAISVFIRCTPLPPPLSLKQGKSSEFFFKPRGFPQQCTGWTTISPGLLGSGLYW